MSMNSMLAGGVNITQTCTTGGGANAAWHVAGCSVGGGTAVVIAAAWIISYMCARRCRSPVLPTSSAASSSHIVPAEHAAPPPATHFYMPHPYPPPSFPCPYCSGYSGDAAEAIAAANVANAAGGCTLPRELLDCC
jgi:hypothetical protein